MNSTTAQSIVKEVIINAPVNKIWQAITDRNKMKEWYFDFEEFKPEPGFEFQFYGTGSKGEKYLHLCQVKEVIKEKNFLIAGGMKIFRVIR